MKDRRVLIVMPELFYGGAEKQFRYIVDGLSRLDEFKVYVCVEGSYQSSMGIEKRKQFCKNNNAEYIFLHGLNAKCGNLKKIPGMIKLYRSICAIIKQKNINVVLGYGALYSAIVPFIKKEKCRVILGERCDGKYKNPLTKRTTKKADMIICNSRSAKEYMEKNGYNNVYYVHNGVETDKRITTVPSGNTFKVVAPARITHTKNQLQIIKAIEKIDSFDVKLIFAGEIQEKDYYQECMDYIERHKLGDKVEFIGNVSDMYELYSQADLVILASYYEGTPNVLLESMAYGILCIASDIVMNADVLKDTRFLFKLNDEQDLKDKIVFVQQLSDEQKKEIADKMYTRIVEEYSTEHMIDCYRKLLY